MYVYINACVYILKIGLTYTQHIYLNVCVYT